VGDSPSRTLKNPFWPRLLKKAQMQGGVTHPCRMGTRGRMSDFRYAAASARASQRRRWAFLSSRLDGQDVASQQEVADDGHRRDLSRPEGSLQSEMLDAGLADEDLNPDPLQVLQDAHRR
jgi:hypothetical protein